MRSKLVPSHVELFLASTNEWQPLIGSLQRTLSADELARASAMVFQEKRDERIVSRGLLRRVLGRYLQRDPADLIFTYSPTGKPALDPAQNPATIQFNVSHSGDRWLMALTVGSAVGVDIERIRELDDLAGMARTVIPAPGMPKFLRLGRAQQEQVLFTQWTRAEATDKATGEGIFAAKTLSNMAVRSQVAVYSFRPCAGFFAAVALAGSVWPTCVIHHLKPTM